MLIDWFTVGAQAVNFLILAWLLKRFLYGPIMKAMQERQKRLAEELAHARTSREEASRRAEDLLRRREELELKAEGLLGVARSEAEQQREQWLAEAQAEVRERSRAWMEGVERERAGLSDRLRTRMAEQVVHLSEKILRDLAGEELEARVVDGFLSRLARSNLDGGIEGHVVVRTGFSLEEDAVSRLKARVREFYPKCSGVEVGHDDALGFGVVMVANDTKWEWNLASYLDDVEEAVFEELAQAKAET